MESLGCLQVMQGPFARFITPHRTTGNSLGTSSLQGFGCRRVLIAKPQEKQVISKQAEMLPYSSHIIMRISQNLHFATLGVGGNKTGICLPLASSPPQHESLLGLSGLSHSTVKLIKPQTLKTFQECSLSYDELK